jgi:hypothetical protein
VQYASTPLSTSPCPLRRFFVQIRKKKRPDYYSLLRVPSVASALEIKSAYKARALECHPDKTADLEPKEKAEAEEKCVYLALGCPPQHPSRSFSPHTTADRPGAKGES